MKPLKYKFSRGPASDQVTTLNIDPDYLTAFKKRIEDQLAPFLKQIIEDEAEIELTIAPNGKDILYWKITNWTAEGYDKLITSNVF